MSLIVIGEKSTKFPSEFLYCQLLPEILSLNMAVNVIDELADGISPFSLYFGRL